MKPMRKEITPEIRAEIDFAYVKNLPQHLHQTVCFYEYWRESPSHISLINFCRVFKVFTRDWRGKGNAGSEFKKLVDMADIFPDLMVMRFTKCAGFPEKPFKEADYKDQTGYMSAPRRGVGESSWGLLLSLREMFEKKGSDQFGSLDHLGFLEQPSLDQHLWPISIDWRYTNDELASSFRQLVERVRPKQFPEPKKAGRAGRSTGAGTFDKLNQLGAFRLDREGFSFDDASPLGLYLSEKGWAKAIRTAKDRIANLATHTLFGDKVVSSGIKF